MQSRAASMTTRDKLDPLLTGRIRISTVICTLPHGDAVGSWGDGPVPPQDHARRVPHQTSCAPALLVPVYGWCTEGFDIAALPEAKALLEEVGG
jgi:hypothetical protein